MASFLKNLINKATNSMSEGINKRVEDGTFNRLASNFGKGISNLGAGMVSIVSMAENAFGKVKDKVSKAKADREQERAERRAEKEERERKAEQLRAERLAMMEQEVVSSGQADDEDDYVAPIALSDDFMERLARIFDIEDECDLHMLCVTRLTAQLPCSLQTATATTLRKSARILKDSRTWFTNTSTACTRVHLMPLSSYLTV